jgi:hypothetical protein
MPLVKRPFPAALPHGELTEVLPDLFFVQGTIRMPGPIPVRFSRNMTVVRQPGGRLVIVNSVRLDEAGLAALDKLGKVTDVVRLAGNHGMDDPFYADRYGAKVWVVKGQRYTSGFNTKAPNVYFEPTHEMDASSSLPIEGAKLIVIDSTPSEGMLLLDMHGGTLISGDCLQHWHAPDAYFNGLGKFIMKRMGFIKPHNVGPGWLKQCKPPREQVRALGELRFANVLTSHGAAVIGDAVSLYKPVLATM